MLQKSEPNYFVCYVICKIQNTIHKIGRWYLPYTAVQSIKQVSTHRDWEQFLLYSKVLVNDIYNHENNDDRDDSDEMTDILYNLYVQVSAGF